jgi:hypothetical protein
MHEYAHKYWRLKVLTWSAKPLSAVRFRLAPPKFPLERPDADGKHDADFSDKGKLDLPPVQARE